MRGRTRPLLVSGPRLLVSADAAIVAPERLGVGYDVPRPYVRISSHASGGSLSGGKDSNADAGGDGSLASSSADPGRATVVCEVAGLNVTELALDCDLSPLVGTEVAFDLEISGGALLYTMSFQDSLHDRAG